MGWMIQVAISYEAQSAPLYSLRVLDGPHPWFS